MNPCGVKVINDWFNIKERGRPMGFFNAASTIGVAVSPPILAAMMLMMGWRWMFITIGILGIFIAIGWYMLYRNREDLPSPPMNRRTLTPEASTFAATR